MLLPSLLYPSSIWSQAVAQILQDVGASQLHWIWEPRIHVLWWRTFRWKMKSWQVKWMSPGPHNLPHCKMPAAVYLCWLSLLVLSSHFVVQIDLCRLTFQWTSIVLFNGNLLFRGSKEISYKEYGDITLGFFNEIIWSIISARKMGSSITHEAVLKDRLLSIPSKHLWALWKVMNWTASLCLKSVIHSSCKRRYCPTQLLLSGQMIVTFPLCSGTLVELSRAQMSVLRSCSTVLPFCSNLLPARNTSCKYHTPKALMCDCHSSLSSFLLGSERSVTWEWSHTQLSWLWLSMSSLPGTGGIL